jgi:hypothetical protein
MKSTTNPAKAPAREPSVPDVPLHEFRKNATEVVRASISNFRGHQLADIRVYYEAPDGTWPTKKGLALGLDLLPELRKAVDALEEAARAKGLAA